MARYRIKQHDLEPPLEIQLLEGSTPIDLSQATAVTFIMKDRTGVKVNAPMVIPDQILHRGVVRYVWALGDTGATGSFTAEVQVMWPNARPQTFPANQYLTIEIQKDLA